MSVGSKPAILSNELPPVLDRGGIDQPVGRVPEKRCGQRHRSSGNCRRHRSGPDNGRQPFEPGADRDGQRDSFVLSQPGQLEPRDGGYGKLICFEQYLRGGRADPFRLCRPPVHDVTVDKDRGQRNSQASPVANSSSSDAALIATPARLALRALGPLAGTRRATVCPCLVISTSSPPSTSSSRARILALVSVAVSLLGTWPLYRSARQPLCVGLSGASTRQARAYV